MTTTTPYRSQRNTSARSKPSGSLLDDNTMQAVAQVACAAVLNAAAAKKWDDCALAMHVAASVLENAIDRDHMRLTRACKSMDRLFPKMPGAR